MIAYPRQWEQIGTPIVVAEIEKKILEVVRNMSCNCLALSGGLDSSLMLSFMCSIYTEVEAFTIGSSESHPDVRYARLVAAEYKKQVKHRVYIPTEEEIDAEYGYSSDMKGDKATRLFYKFVWKYKDRIIACDGADELFAGYYGHQTEDVERLYYEYLRTLQREQLVPLDKNSGKLKIYLPYLDKGLLNLLYQIPIAEKVNKTERKIFMVEMARGRVPDSVIRRRKIGFCSALEKKE